MLKDRAGIGPRIGQSCPSERMADAEMRNDLLVCDIFTSSAILNIVYPLYKVLAL